jgi:hypothetical protein
VLGARQLAVLVCGLEPNNRPHSVLFAEGIPNAAILDWMDERVW